MSVESHRFAQGVRVVAALSDADPSPFALVPCSHKLNIEAPSALIPGDDMARFAQAAPGYGVVAADFVAV